MLRKLMVWGWCGVALVGGAWPVMADDEAAEAITDVSKCGPDYKIQGEYAGSFDIGQGAETKFGLQVVSLGGDKYRGVAYFGGLPGDGWDGFGRLEAEGEMKDGVITLVANEGTATIQDGVVSIKTADGQELGKLEKVSRESPTMGMKAPEGAIVLFDGKSAAEWDGGGMTEDNLLKAGCTSKKKFKDCTLHLEFMLPYMPTATGQARGNSGVYLQDRYELQVLDSFACEGLNNECGGFYQKKHPRENMCYPPLTWQTYDIDFTAPKFEDGKKVKNAMVTVKHNGATIHENLEIDGITPGRETEETAEAGPIHLQYHGNPVVYRNVWVVEKTGDDAAADTSKDDSKEESKSDKS